MIWYYFFVVRVTSLEAVHGALTNINIIWLPGFLDDYLNFALAE